MRFAILLPFLLCLVCVPASAQRKLDCPDFRTRVRTPAFRFSDERLLLSAQLTGRMGFGYYNPGRLLEGEFKTRALFQPQLGIRASLPIGGNSWLTAGIAVSQHAHGLRINLSANGAQYGEAFTLYSNLARLSVGYMRYLNPSLRLSLCPEFVYGDYYGFATGGINGSTNAYYRLQWDAPQGHSFIEGAAHLALEQRIYKGLFVTAMAQIDFFETAPVYGTIEIDRGSPQAVVDRAASNPRQIYFGVGITYDFVALKRD